jgi:hypothetical protein
MNFLKNNARRSAYALRSERKNIVSYKRPAPANEQKQQTKKQAHKLRLTNLKEENRHTQINWKKATTAKTGRDAASVGGARRAAMARERLGS